MFFYCELKGENSEKDVPCGWISLQGIDTPFFFFAFDTEAWQDYWMFGFATIRHIALKWDLKNLQNMFF